MKTLRAFALVGAVLLFSFSAFSQNSPGRGAWLTGGSGLIRHDLDRAGRNFFASPSIRVGYFLSDRWVVGLEAAAFYSYINELNNYSLVDFRPFARYYFGDEAQIWRPFAYASPGWQQAYYRFQSLRTRGNGYSADAGGGVAFFLSTALALEATVGYSGTYGEMSPRQNILYRLGIQAYLQRRNDEEKTAAPLIQKGAMQIGLSGDGGLANIGLFDDWYFSIRPSVAYFVANKLAAGGGLTFAFAQNNAIIEPEPFVRYYLAGANSRIQPVLEAGAGFRFQLANQRDDPGFFNANIKLGAGVAWFVRHNIALEGVFYYSKFRLEEENADNNDYLDFVIGFQYFFKPAAR